MTIYLFELRKHLKSLLIWFSVLLVIMIVASVEFEVYQGDEEIRQAMDAFDPFFQALGMDNVDFTTAIGFLAIFSIYTYLPLSIYSGLLGLNILSKEEHKKTSEFLLTMPVKRTTIITAKISAAVTLTFVLNLLLHLAIFIIFYRFDTSSSFVLFVSHMALGVLMTQLIFLLFAFGISVILKRQKVLNGSFLVLIIVTFMLNMLIGYIDNPYFLPYLTPFQYFSASQMVEGNFRLSYLIITLFLSVTTLSFSYYYYPKKNITI
ncbi:MAG: ABC transporter permease [Candidatus Izimaplasma sp.]|nr:ABC transporter permease [Candidatus Izimaplasma bacterium]